MTFAEDPLDLPDSLTMSAACAYAKKVPKYEQARQLTPEQAALVQKAIGREKVLIKEIQQRTPLVETYIQDTRPDVKLYEVPVDDQYMLSRVDFGKGFFDKGLRAAPERKKPRRAFFKGSLLSITGLTKALGLEKFTYNPNGFMEMMFIDPSGFDQQHYVFSYVRREFLGTVRTGSLTSIPRRTCMAWAASTAASGLRTRAATLSVSTAPTPGPTNEDASKYYFHFDSWRHERAARYLAAGCGLR